MIDGIIKERSFIFMKKAVLILLVLIFLFCSCGESEPKMLPRGTSMVITFLSPELGEELHFSDFDGKNFLASRFVMPTGTDDELPENTTFLINPENGVSVKQKNFEPSAVTDGEYYYNFGKYDGNTPSVKRRPWWNDEYENLFPIFNDSAAELYHSGKYIIAASEYEKNLHLEFYNIENETQKSGIYERDIETPKILGVPNNGYICIAEKTSGGYFLKAADPEKPEKLISSDGKAHKEIYCAAFDGKTFVFSTDEGLFFCVPGGEPEKITGVPHNEFAFIKGDFVIFPNAADDSDGSAVLCYNIKHRSLSVVLEGRYSIELIADGENMVVFRKVDSPYDYEYVTFQWIPRTKVYQDDEVNTMPLMIQANGIQYMRRDRAEAPDEKYIIGKVTSCIYDITEAPTRDGQSNFPFALDCYYAIVDGVFIASERNSPDGVLAWYEYEACR